jgi:hypothetical protein
MITMTYSLDVTVTHCIGLQVLRINGHYFRHRIIYSSSYV